MKLTLWSSALGACAFAPSLLAQQCLPATITPGGSACWIDWAPSTTALDASIGFDDAEKDMAVADFDLDGDDDVVIVRKEPIYSPGGRSNALFLNDNGVLIDATALIQSNTGAGNELSSRDVCVLDIENDGYPDFAVANTDNSPVRLFRNRGHVGGVWDGFEEVANFLFDDLCPDPLPCAEYLCDNDLWSCAIACEDLNNDGYDDMWVTTYGNGSAATPSTSGDRIYLNRADGSGIFDDVTHAALVYCPGSVNGMTSGLAADFDGDGWVDLFRGGPFADHEILWNDKVSGIPSFSTRTRIDGGGYMGAMGDLDADGDLDYYLVADGCDRVKLNPGGASARTQALWDASLYSLNVSGEHDKTMSTGGNILFQDLDEDGVNDIYLCDIDVGEPSSVNTGIPYACTLRNMTPAGGPFVSLEDPNATELVPINLDDTSVYDGAFLDLDLDGTDELLLGTVDGYRVMRRSLITAKYGPAVPHSGGVGVSLTSQGRPSLSENNFTLVATDAPGPVNGELYYGFAPAVITPFYDGVLLVQPPLKRLGAIQADANGTFTVPIDFSQPPFSSGPAAVSACQTIYFQLYYRDPGSTNTGANTSNGLAVPLWK